MNNIVRCVSEGMWRGDVLKDWELNIFKIIDQLYHFILKMKTKRDVL